MRIQFILFALLINVILFVNLFAQTMPLVYDVENTGADCPIPYLPSFSELPTIQPLPDPFMWADGRGRISNYSDWRYRRAEIKAEIENYEIGEKPDRPDSITASYSDSVLTVNVTENGQTLTLTSRVILPSGTGPFPAIIGMTFFAGSGGTGSLPASIFTSRNIATIEFVHDQVSSYGGPQTSDPYYKLYPYLNFDNTGQYSAWAWGVSRLIDGLELVQNDLPIDLKHIAVTGCSYAGKMALFAGAFDERIALTLAIESGGGGATSWRYSHSEPTGSVECIDNTNYSWFMNSMHQFEGNNVWRMPEDHHELMAMCAPRALFVTANPDYTWLSNPSSDVCSRATQQVYNGLGIPDRFGFSIVGNHGHCAIPSSQTPEIEAFVDKFLLNDTTANTDVSTSPYSINLSSWITWVNPTLSNDSSYFGKASLIYPSDLQTGVDTSVTFSWSNVKNAEKYFIQLSLSPIFASIAKSDSTTDTLKIIDSLLPGKAYYWRVRTKNTSGLFGPWSNLGHFSTAIALPEKPELGSIIPYPNRDFWYTFNWKKVQYADQYLIQLSSSETFSSIFTSATTADTLKLLYGFSEGQTYYWRVQASNVAGSGPWSDVLSFIASVTDIKENEKKIPTEYSLSQNYPNPFNPSTKIRFTIPTSPVNPSPYQGEGNRERLATLKIYDILGNEVSTLVNKELEPGYYSIDFNSSVIGELPSGVYFYQLRAGSFIETKKMLLLR